MRGVFHATEKGNAAWRVIVLL